MSNYRPSPMLIDEKLSLKSRKPDFILETSNIITYKKLQNLFKGFFVILNRILSKQLHNCARNILSQQKNVRKRLFIC